MVYRVRKAAIAPERRGFTGSALVGSREIVVGDLREDEFDLLFADDRADADVVRLMIDERSGAARTSREEALDALERRVAP